MSSAVDYWINGRIGLTPERQAGRFTGWDYYLMCPNDRKVLAFLREDQDEIESGHLLQRDWWYRVAHRAIMDAKPTDPT